jgi:choline kinase
MKGLIAAAGLSTRLQDLGESRNKVLMDLGGETLLGNILHHFRQQNLSPPIVVVGHDALAVRDAYGECCTCVLNPHFEHYGILSSVWQALPLLRGEPFVFTTGDHYFDGEHLRSFLADQPGADVLVDVEVKTCDDEDMKVFLTRGGQLRTMTKTFLRGGVVLGEFTGLVRFSAEGSGQLFDTLNRHVWHHGLQGYVADILCQLHCKWELAFHLSTDHHRVDVDFPCDLARARQLYAQRRGSGERVARLASGEW